MGMMTQTIIDLFSLTREEWLEKARDKMAQLLTTGAPYVTSDDVWKHNPLPSYLHKNTLGSVFNNQFRSIGYQKSKRPSANGRVIQQWVLKHPRKHVEYENE